MITRRYAECDTSTLTRVGRAEIVFRHLLQVVTDVPVRLRYWFAEFNSTGYVVVHKRGAWRLRHIGWRRLTHRQRANRDIPATDSDAAGDWAADRVFAG